jgi:exopolyphosphatase/guanosine-5'-triphosphate,3'-diphosphate pyrophosphatase
MELNDYPLRILQSYRIPAESLIDLTNRLLTPDKELLQLMQLVNAKRVTTLPAAAAVLRNVLIAGNFKQVVTSSFGVREGMVLDQLDPTTRQKDPLTAGIRAMMSSNPSNWEYGKALVPWLSQAAAATLPTKLSETACLAVELGSRMHPDYQADMTFEWIATAPLAGWSHSERAAIALAIGCRYQRGYTHPIASQILDSKTTAAARSLGALMRLATHFSARSKDLLQFARLTIDEGVITLDVDGDKEALASSMVRKRLQQAASIMALEPRLTFDGLPS